MSIFHTFKRKLRSRRRLQDGVSAHDAGCVSSFRHDCRLNSYAEDYRKILTQLEAVSARPSPELEPWVLAALERMENTAAFNRSWFTPVSDEERKTFRELSQEQKETALEIATRRLNMMAGNTYLLNYGFQVDWEGRLSVRGIDKVEKK